MKHWIAILCVVLAMVGCRPSGVLSNQEMRDVLYDLHRMDGALQVAGYTFGHNQEVAAYYQSVLDRHGITQAQFDSSLVWYTDNPQIFNKIYPKVVERLQADFDYQVVLRDERVERKRSEKAQSVELSGAEDSNEPSVPQKTVEEWVKTYMFGIENPWQEWKSEEFCEKNVVVFGVLTSDSIPVLAQRAADAAPAAAIELQPNPLPLAKKDTVLSLKKLAPSPFSDRPLRNHTR